MTNAMGVPIRYIGKKPSKEDNVAFTGLRWAPGEVHVVSHVVAAKLLRHPDIWEKVDIEEINANPGVVGDVLLTGGDDVPDGEGGGDEIVGAGSQADSPPALNQSFDLPNLQGMTKADLQTFSASQFNYQLNATMKKEQMIDQIVALANSRAAA